MRAAFFALLMGMYAVNVWATAPTSTDPRVVWWLDPRVPWAGIKQIAMHNTAKPDKSVQTIPEPGLKGSSSDYTLSRGADPLNSSKKAYRHKIASNFPMWWNNTKRSEIGGYWGNWGQTTLRGVDYWVAWAIKPGPDMFGHTNGPVLLQQFLHVSDAGDSIPYAPFAMYSDGTKWFFWSNWNPNNPTTWSQVQNRIGGAGTTTLWSESNPDKNVWHKFVMKVRFHWDARQGPYIQIWRAKGTGAPVMIVNRSGPNCYNDKAVYIPQKFGLYKWDSWGSTTSRTMYHKGYYILRAAPGTPTLNQNSMFELLNQI